MFSRYASLIFALTILGGCAPQPPKVSHYNAKPFKTGPHIPDMHNKKDDVVAHLVLAPESSTPVPPPEPKPIILNFEYNHWDLTPHKQTLDSIASRPGIKRIEIRGRTDNKHTTDRDKVVAHQRADSVREYLIARGVPAQVIDVNFISAGDYRFDINGPEAALNRRSEIFVYE
jgi:outer membrane protein OmpA-like peptidoglycan-associated protein